jgi:type VI secretion system FHA domain protein
MALRLRIISEHRRALGERSTVVFDLAGGSIGRSAENDWVLPDPMRYVSARHARIHYRQGAYVLEDVSTNGVFVNDDERPLARLGPYQLQNGDLLRFGEYQVVVAIEAAKPEALRAVEDSAIVSGAVPTRIEALQSLGRASQTDLGAALKLDELLVSDGLPTGVQAVNAYGQAVAVSVPAADPPAAAPEPEADEQALARRMERLARAVAKAREAKGVSLPALYDVQSGLQTFCRGAGIDAAKLPADAQTRLLHLAGQLLREALVGLKDVERARHEIHNRFRVELAADPNDPRPSLARSGIEELLIQILAQHESRRLDAIQWLREALEGTKSHERAMVEAMREAFVEFVGRFDPAELEARFQRAARRGRLAGGGTARYWELFTEFYRNLTEMPPDHLPHTFVEAFANAYRRTLQQPGETPAGTDTGSETRKSR